MPGDDRRNEERADEESAERATGDGEGGPPWLADDVADVVDLDGPADEEVALRDDDLHRPDELDGKTVACTITETEAEKRAAWMRAELVPHLEAVERRTAESGSGDGAGSEDPSGGYTLLFAEEALEAVMRFARHEHWCCSFAHFEVHVTPGEEPNELTVYGPDGTDEMFGAEFVDRMAEAAGVQASA